MHTQGGVGKSISVFSVSRAHPEVHSWWSVAQRTKRISSRRRSAHVRSYPTGSAMAARLIAKGTRMAIVRVDFSTKQPAEFAPTVSRVINACMQQVLGVSPTENYIVCQAYPAEAILHAPDICSTERLEKIAFIQIT